MKLKELTTEANKNPFSSAQSVLKKKYLKPLSLPRYPSPFPQSPESKVPD
jgi:hypothetical protein